MLQHDLVLLLRDNELTVCEEIRPCVKGIWFVEAWCRRRPRHWLRLVMPKTSEKSVVRVYAASRLHESPVIIVDVAISSSSILHIVNWFPMLYMESSLAYAWHIFLLPESARWSKGRYVWGGCESPVVVLDIRVSASSILIVVNNHRIARLPVHFWNSTAELL